MVANELIQSMNSINNSLQTGITENDNISHHVMSVSEGREGKIVRQPGSNVVLQYTAIAIASVRMYPSAPSNDGTFPRALTLVYSAGHGVVRSCSTISMSSLFAFATALIPVERQLLYRPVRMLAVREALQDLQEMCTAFQKTC